jgi:hypothetical protein
MVTPSSNQGADSGHPIRVQLRRHASAAQQRSASSLSLIRIFSVSISLEIKLDI